jgi:biotin synthase
MAFMAGANAIFTVGLPPSFSSFASTDSLFPQGERMLTTPTSGWTEDHAMLDRWGLKGMRSFESTTVRMKENPAALNATEERKAALAAGASAPGVAGETEAQVAQPSTSA